MTRTPHWQVEQRAEREREIRDALANGTLTIRRLTPADMERLDRDRETRRSLLLDYEYDEPANSGCEPKAIA
jgi:hypothetical protein